MTVSKFISLGSNCRGPQRLDSSHGGKASRRGSRKAAHAAAVGHGGWLFYIFVNDIKTRKLCVSKGYETLQFTTFSFDVV
jgi:hypothetical protein